MNAARKANWFNWLERPYRIILIAISLSGTLLTGAYYVWGYTTKVDMNCEMNISQNARLEKLETKYVDLQLKISESLTRVETNVQEIKERLDRREDR